jgi:glycosyltransferase involved in cell wall biosynthesis
MELNSGNTKAKSAYEVALERASRMPAAPAQGERGAIEPILYDDDGYAVTDNVSVQNLSFASQAKAAQTSMFVDSSAVASYDIGSNFDMEDITEMPKLPEPDAEKCPVSVHWGGPMFDYGGYARMNRTYVIGLHSMGSIVKTIPMATIENVNKSTLDFLRRQSNVNLSNKYPRVYGMTIPDLMAHRGMKILYTMMETSKGIHKELVDRYNMADELWVPCTWNYEVFKDAGVVAPIRIMPLGVDTDAFCPDGDKLDLPGHPFKFLSVFGWSYRKGFDVMIQAFLEEFSKKEEVTFVLSTRFVGQAGKKDRIKSDFAHIRSMVAKPDSELPHISLHNGYTADVDMPKLYRSCHCFVLPSRGEGQGLPYMEAGACGLPVIASDHGGQRDFLDSEVAYMVEPDSYFTSRKTDSSFKNMAWISHFYEDQQFPDYGRAAIDKLRAHMRFVYENHAEAKKKTALLRKRLVEKFDWRLCVERVHGRLMEICGGIKP